MAGSSANGPYGTIAESCQPSAAVQTAKSAPRLEPELPAQADSTAAFDAAAALLRDPVPWRLRLAKVMRQQVGLQRSAASLETALDVLEGFPGRLVGSPEPDAITAANAALVARLIATGALLRQESRGAHFRTDRPESDDNWRVHIVQARGQAPHAVERVGEALSRAA